MYLPWVEGQLPRSSIDCDSVGVFAQIFQKMLEIQIVLIFNNIGLFC